MSQYELLTVGNPKTAKGKELGYAVAVLHLAPSTLSGHNVCPMASDGCIAACLNTAGRGGIFRAGETTNTIQQARIRRTQLLYSDRGKFLDMLERDVIKFVAWCEREGYKPALRLNGTSDLDWNGMAPNLMARIVCMGVVRYDYTKVPNRAQRVSNDYHVTFSLSETNEPAARKWLANGGRVAVVFRTAALPTHLPRRHYPVVDGDETTCSSCILPIASLV
jgi:hypothetical protein